MQKGNVFIMNDPYRGGTHIPDITVVVPVIYHSKLVAIAASMAHHQDLGGMAPGSTPTNATEIYQEGLQLPAIKVFDGGEPIASIIDLIEANVRLPDMIISDLHAGVAAIRA